MSSATPIVVVVSAPSGAGKSTVLRRVLAEVPGLRFSISHTTRPPRAGERDGVDYHFVSRPEFDALISSGRMLEWADVHDHRYGTCYAEYERASRDGVDLLLDVDVQGAAQVRLKLREAVSVFILPPSYRDLERRLHGRGLDDEAAIRGRLAAAREELSLYREYDYALVNDDFERCVDSLKCLIRAARCRTSRMDGEAGRILGTFETDS